MLLRRSALKTRSTWLRRLSEIFLANGAQTVIAYRSVFASISWLNYMPETGLRPSMASNPLVNEIEGKICE